MVKYILKRLLYAFLTLWLLCTVTFFMMRALPGDPFIGPKPITPETKAALEEKYGLNKPMIVQYGLYFLNLAKGDLGISISTNRQINDVIVQAFPYSFDLGIRSLIFAVVFGIGFGTIAAIKKGTFWDTGTMLIAILGVSIPSFIVGALLQFFVSIKFNDLLSMMIPGFKLFPVQGWSTEMSKVLPALALGLGSLATISRLMRTSMIDVLNSDYIKTARAKGLSSFAITTKHAIRNAILPVVTVLGPITAALLTGGFVVEKIFNIPGMGKFFVNAIVTNDYTLISGTTLFYGAFLIIANLLVDLAYGFIDPRIRLSGNKA